MTPEEVIDQLVARRLEKGWTQEELASWIGVTQVAVCNYETGARRLDAFGWLIRWARALGYDLDLELRERKG